MKKLACFILSACMLFSIFTVAAAEDTAPVSLLYIGGVDAIATPEGEGWSFDAESGVLTLTDCTVTGSGVYVDEWETVVDAAVYFAGDLTIELVGDNHIERSIDTAPSDHVQYAAIWAQDVSDVSTTLAICGDGSLTAGIEFPEEALDWEYLGFSCGIMCLAEGGVDLTGLHGGGYLDVYGGVSGVEGAWVAKAWNSSPTFGDGSIVVAYRDVEGTVENEFGYNWNNNDAWRMRVLTDPAYMSAGGRLTLANDGEAAGEGWTWKDRVLTLDEGVSVKTIYVSAGLDGASIVLKADLTIDSTSLGYVDAIETHSDLTVYAGGYVLTAVSNDYVISADCASITLTDGEFIFADEYGSEFPAVFVGGGGISLKDASVTAETGYLQTTTSYDEEYNEFAPGDIIIEDSDISVAYIEAGASVNVTSSALSFGEGWNAVYAYEDISMVNSSVQALSKSGDVICAGGSIGIDNCELDINAGGIAISACNYGEEGDLLTFTNMTVSQPASYTVGAVVGEYGNTFYSILDAEGAAVSVLKALPAVSAEPEAGDSNGDGAVNIIDLTLSAQYIAQGGLTGDFDLSGCDFAAMDINGDGVIDQLDLNAIAAIIRANI